jgi:hypothetical protein
MKPMETRVRVAPGAETKNGPTTEYAEGVYVDTLDDGRIAVLLDVPNAEDHPVAAWRESLDMGPGQHYAMGLSAIADADTVVEIIKPN